MGKSNFLQLGIYFFFNFLKLYSIFRGMCSCPRVSADAQGGQERELGALEFKLHTAVSRPTRVLGTNLQSSGRATSTRDCWTIVQMLGIFFLIKE